MAVTTSSRVERRMARTRQALIEAAARLIAEGRAGRASIQEITEYADIGFGSFYTYFDSKDELFRVASQEFLKRWGDMIDRACTDIEDPAERFAASLRISGRLSWTHPEVARFLIGVGLDILDEPAGLAPRARRDIRNGQLAARFTIADTELALQCLAGRGYAFDQDRCDRHRPRPAARRSLGFSAEQVTVTRTFA